MRVKRVRKKIKQRVLIPKNLKKFLGHVYELILKKDEATQIESDDLLQDDFITTAASRIPRASVPEDEGAAPAAGGSSTAS